MRSALTVLLVAALLGPAAAAAQFEPLPPAPPPEPETVATAPGTEGSGISGLQEAFLILAGVVLVVGIGVAITRDARRNAPADPRPGRSGASGPTAGVGERKKPDPRAAQRQRAAAKRARQARRKNRPARK